jgi:hypothetical protein
MPEQTLMPGTNWQGGSNTAQPQKGVHSMFQKGQTDIITGDSALSTTRRRRASYE